MRRGMVALVSVVGAGALAAPATAGEGANPWLERRVLDLAHQGGEWELPSNTMYAFKRAVRKGVDMIELDVHSTASSRSPSSGRARTLYSPKKWTSQRAPRGSEIQPR